MTKKNNKQIINILNFFKMEKNNVKEEQQFTAPVENAAEQQVEKKPWYKKTWGKLVIAAAAVSLGVVGTAVAVKKLKGTTDTETATDNAVEVEEQQKETPRENNNSRRDRFESRRQQWNNQQ